MLRQTTHDEVKTGFDLCIGPFSLFLLLKTKYRKKIVKKMGVQQYVVGAFSVVISL